MQELPDIIISRTRWSHRLVLLVYAGWPSLSFLNISIIFCCIRSLMATLSVRQRCDTQVLMVKAKSKDKMITWNWDYDWSILPSSVLEDVNWQMQSERTGFWAVSVAGTALLPPLNSPLVQLWHWNWDSGTGIRNRLWNWAFDASIFHSSVLEGVSHKKLSESTNCQVRLSSTNSCKK